MLAVGSCEGCEMDDPSQEHHHCMVRGGGGGVRNMDLSLRDVKETY